MGEAPTTRPARGAALARTAAAGATVAGAIAAIDLIGTPSVAPVAFGLAAVAGGFGGAVFALLAHAPRTKPKAALALGAVALTATLSWAIALGAIRRWGSEHHTLALGLWIAAPLAAGGVVALGLLTRRSTEEPSWLAERFWAMGAVLALALALAFADGRLFPDTYPLFHRLLKTLAWLSATAAFTALLELKPPADRVARLLGGGLVLAMPLALVTTQLSAPTAEAIAARPWAGFVLARLRSAVDVDGDGYAGVLHGGDCAPFDYDIGPGAVEIPGNGIDEDCIGGDAPARAERLPLPPVPDSPSPRSVVLITIDALRADRLGIYGHDRPTSPTLDAFFADGLIFERAYTAGGYTSIALPALMRGTPPRRIEWARVVQTSALRLVRPPLPELPSGERWIYSYTLPLDDPHATWPELLARRGMTGVGVVDDGASDFLSSRWGTGEGFESYTAVDVPFGAADGDDKVARAALEAMDGAAPFFRWLHFYGPHWPDSEHPDLPRFGDSVADKYDHEIAHVDRVLAPVLERLARLGAVVVLTADHGEVFHDDGRSHGRTMDEAAIRVPLLVRGPGIAGGRRADVVSTLDVFPTLLALTETPAPENAGVSLLEEPDPARVVLVDSWVFDKEGQPELDLTAAIHRDGKLVRDRLRRTTELTGDPATAPRLEAAIADYYRSGAAPRIDGGTLASE